MELETLEKELKSALSEIDGQIQGFIQKSNEEAEANAKLGRENGEAMKVLEEKSGEMIERLLDLEQKQSARLEMQETAQKSVGQEFTESEEFLNMQKGTAKMARLEVKNTTVGSDTTVAPDRRPNIISGAFRRLRVSDVLSQGNTSSNAVEYVRESTFTNNAAETAENSAKPETDITFALVNQPVATIAHWLKLTKQVMDDAPMLASYIDTRMRYGVEYRLDSQLINGDGTGANISGMLDSGNYTAFSSTMGDSAMVSIRKAITDVVQADYQPTAIILNPAEVEALDLTAAGTTDDTLIAANPRIQNAQTIWGLPIVETNAIAANSFVCAAFDVAYQQWNRQGVTVDLSESDDTNFQSNLVTLRAELRSMLASYRPASAVGGTLTS